MKRLQCADNYHPGLRVLRERVVESNRAVNRDVTNGVLFVKKVKKRERERQ